MEDDIELFMMFFLIVITYLNICEVEEKKSPKTQIQKRSCWVRKDNLTRNINGFFITCFQNIKKNDPKDFFKHTRMSPAVFDTLLNLLETDLTKYSHRKAISAECRLALTLSYLAQGTSQQYLSSSFKIGRSTVRSIILDTCEVIYKCLSAIYLVTPNVENYNEIANDFENLWDLPNCVGALDGKHITIQCSNKSNVSKYKKNNRCNVVLLATCDASHIFTAVDVKSYETQTEGGILSNLELGIKLFDNKIPLPKEKNLPKTEIPFPYYFVAATTFPLKKNILRAYPGRLTDLSKRIYNYRISRARKIIENAFGILVSRWRVLESTMTCFPANAEKIILATIVLHNFLKTNQNSSHLYCPPNYVDHEDENGEIIPGHWRKDCGRNSILTSAKMGSNNAAKSAFQLRDTLKNYFIEEGKIDKQNRIK